MDELRRAGAVRWVVFDLGDVLLRRTTRIPELAELCGIDAAVFEPLYFAGRAGYDRHSDPALFFGELCATAGVPVPAEDLLARLVEIDDLGWSEIDPDTMALVELAARSGADLAVLSNAPASMGTLVRAAPWSTAFRHLVFSGDHGVVKPSADIFRLLLQTLQARPDETVLVDDRADNVEGARRIGMHAVHFTSAEQARTELRSLLGPGD
ncbi:HAD-IA family hydrolase [Nakamurella sp. YIM 132087]|uniref:HAD-IA family hydrolase n=1 Tax=Nakamurella alba TaxID=2665158 RepID=A0A7K1FPI0_9ACTN|nr:HAD family phosphatase [Nakamurella alba]MTD16046.1 HAD-IA family hydrolase [Nakamurella alba]